MQNNTMSEVMIIDDNNEMDKIEFPQLHSLTIDCVPNLVSFYYKPMTSDMELKSVTDYENDSAIEAPLFYEKISFPNLESLKLSSINLRKIWDDKLSEYSYIQNLKNLIIDGCSNLRFLFPTSVARGLVNLQHLNITRCALLEEIFFIEGIMDNLPSAKISLSKEEVIRSVEELSLSSKDVTLICNDQQTDDDFSKLKVLRLQRFNSSDEFPTGFIQRFTNLEKLTLFTSCFINVTLGEHAQIKNKLKTLTLNSLWYLDNICPEKSQMEQILQNLEALEVIYCLSLKTMAPSFVIFQNLDTLKVSYCAALLNIISSSTARSLLRLRMLWIKKCDMLEEIVVNEDNDASEIALMKLESLVLTGLPRLTSFCKGNLPFKFPLLQTLYVMECPMMETFSQGVFSAPLLRRLRVTTIGKGGEWRWDGDLNTTITRFFKETHSKEV